MSEAPVLDARGLVASRDGDAGPVRVLDGVDLVLAAGEVVELVGPSGVGKTTLLLALARLLPGATGDLLLDGRAASDIDPREWRTQVALLPQRPALTPGTVAESLLEPWVLRVREGAQAPSAEELRALLDDVGLEEVSVDRDIRKLSVGQASRVALLRTLTTHPRVLLLDEPDASLDDASAAQVAAKTRAFAEAGGAIVRVSHVRADEGATRRVRLAGGKLEEVERD